MIHPSGRFCHVLETTQQRWPEYRALFLFYKLSKKQIKTLASPDQDATTPSARLAEQRFVDALCQQIQNLNTFRVDRQATAVRTLVDLRANMAIIGNTDEERERIYQELVNFHGETLLLMHWNILGETKFRDNE